MCDLLPLLGPCLFRDFLSLVSTPDKRIQECFFIDETVQEHGQVDPDIIPLVSHRIILEFGHVVPGAVQILPVGAELLLEIPGRRGGVGDQVLRPQIVLAETLVEVLRAGFGEVDELLPDGPFRSGGPACRDGQQRKQDGQEEFSHATDTS